MECRALLRMIHNQESLDNTMYDAIREMDEDGDDELTISDFIKYQSRFPGLTAPAFRLRDQMCSLLCGKRWWEQQAVIRKKRFGKASGMDILTRSGGRWKRRRATELAEEEMKAEERVDSKLAAEHAVLPEEVEFASRLKEQLSLLYSYSTVTDVETVHGIMRLERRMQLARAGTQRARDRLWKAIDARMRAEEEVVADKLERQVVKDPRAEVELSELALTLAEDAGLSPFDPGVRMEAQQRLLERLLREERSALQRKWEAYRRSWLAYEQKLLNFGGADGEG
eukprot:PLAT7261.2.p1 GENE.PLAT7261.2~~PLAT7261.2.p1  ORF type:complete len:283 (+),score=104.94 PLAT7261.2:500-1348(+)